MVCTSSPDMVQVMPVSGVSLDLSRKLYQYDPTKPGKRANEVGVTTCGYISPCGCFDLDNDGTKEVCAVDTTKPKDTVTIQWYNGLSDVACPVAGAEGGPGGQE
jgi:hypothetical protein